MKIKIILICLISISYSLALDASNRVSEHNTAAEKFYNWHFFENGRGMTITPNLSKLMWMLADDNRDHFNENSQNNYNSELTDPMTNFIEKRYGLIVRNKKLMGIYNVKYKKMEIGVLGCTACHSGKAAGIIIPGLGNKTIDPYKIGKDTFRIQRFWSSGRNADYKYIYKKAQHFAKITSDSNISSLTRGLVPDSTIKTFFYQDQGLQYPKDMGRAQVKVPHLWGIAQKRKAGIFNDGSLNGDSYAWIFGAELFASDSAEHLRNVLPKIKKLTDEVLAKLLPPKYPYSIDLNLANKGKQLFKKTCLKCHGPHNYDAENLAIYSAPKVIAKHKVLTDTEKLKAIDPEFVNLVEKSSLSDLLTFNYDLIQKGYFAPKLWGIWSRFPYLHNGSIASLFQLLQPQSKRSSIFSMYQAGEEKRFDQKNIGLTLFNQSEYKKMLSKAQKGDRDIYFTQREGQSNKGHYFKSFDSFTNADRYALIEYMKSL